jgi:hypothetical protein
MLGKGTAKGGREATSLEMDTVKMLYRRSPPPLGKSGDPILTTNKRRGTTESDGDTTAP